MVLYNIGLNLLYLVPGKIGGGEIYARALLAHMAAQRTAFRFTVFLNALAWDSFAWIDNTSHWQRVLCPVSTSPWKRHIAEQANFPRWGEQHKLDLLHSLGYVLPLQVRCPQAVTIHDVLFRLEPSFLSASKRVFWNVMIPRSARKAKVVITDSEAAARDIQNYLRIPEQKVRVAHLGPGQPLPDPTPWPVLSDRYNIRRPFFLAVGTNSHKRLDVIRDAIARLQHAGQNVSLVITGPFHSRHSKGADAIGRVPEADLAGLYSQAQALVCASAMEGFGLPALEAMQAGTPVIVCERGSMPEIVGPDGVVVPYGDVPALAAAMESLLKDPAKRQTLIELGRKRVSAFSWSKCAEETLRAYDSALNLKLQVENRA